MSNIRLPQPENVTAVNVECTDIHEILTQPDDMRKRKLLKALDFLIGSQASLHRAYYEGDEDMLGNAIEKRVNTFRGFILHTDEGRPLSYAIYYPMIDSEGKRAAYCEDFYIVESFRGHGVAKILFNEIAQRTLEDGHEYLQWATDKRNGPVHHYVQNKLGCEQAAITTLCVESILDAASNAGKQGPVDLAANWNNAQYSTRLITENDINRMRALNLGPELIRNTGDLPFKGFITFKGNDLITPVAITPAWKHLSTFRLREGMIMEHPTIRAGEDLKAVVTSIGMAARQLVHDGEGGLDRVRWHIHDDKPELKRVLVEDFKCYPDSMVGTPDSEFTAYRLKNGTLKRTAEAYVPREIQIDFSAPIGLPRPSASVPPVVPTPKKKVPQSRGGQTPGFVHA